MKNVLPTPFAELPLSVSPHVGHSLRLRLLILFFVSVAVVALGIKGVTTAPVVAERLVYPFQLDDAEGVILAEATLIAHGTNPYEHQQSPATHFYAGPYPPVYTLINTAAIAMLGPTMKVGRAMQLFATCAVSCWLLWAVGWPRRIPGGLGWIIGAWIGLLWGTAHLVVVWSSLVRPDMTALACNLLGIVVLRHWWRIPRTAIGQEPWPRGQALATLALGAFCFALGWWTKQTFVAVPLAFFCTTIWARPRGTITVAVCYAAMIALPFTVFTAVTNGGFAQKVIGYQGSWSVEAFIRIAAPVVARYALLIAIAIIFAVLVSIQRRVPTFAVMWCIFASVAALGAGTSGGNHNHFVEVLAAAALLIGQGVSATLADVRVSRIGDSLRAVGVIFVVVALTATACLEREGRHGWLANVYRIPTAQERDGSAAVASYLANTTGPVYSDNVGILVLARQTVRVTDPFTMAAEVRLGRWDDSAVVADVAAGNYAVIAVREDHFDPEHPPTDMTPALVQAIQSRYRLTERNVLNLYVPK